MKSSPRLDNLASSPDDVRGYAAFRASNLAWSQWLLWHEQRRRPPVMLSPLSAAFVFSAGLDAREFRQAFQSVVDRSDALRTVFVEEEGVPRRYVLPRLPMALDIVDLSAAYQPAAAYEQWLADRELRPLSPALRPFDSTLVRLGDQHFIWRLALHRLIGDSHSLLLIYLHTAAAYAAAAAGTPGSLPPLSPFEKYVVDDRQRALEAAPPDGRSSRAPARITLSPPVRGERFGLDLGLERTAGLRRAARELVAEDAGAWAGHGPGAALFALCAAGLAVLLARLRGCRTVCIDTALDVRATGQWQNTIGCISRPQRLTVGVTEGQTPAHLLRTVGAALAQVQQQRQVAPAGEHPAACRALLELDDVTFPPFGEFAVKVERLDTCYSLRKTRAPELEPVVCLAIDSYNSPDNLKAAFTLCDGHLPNGRVPELAQAYLRLLDALIAAREQPL